MHSNKWHEREKGSKNATQPTQIWKCIFQKKIQVTTKKEFLEKDFRVSSKDRISLQNDMHPPSNETTILAHNNRLVKSLEKKPTKKCILVQECHEKKLSSEEGKKIPGFFSQKEVGKFFLQMALELAIKRFSIRRAALVSVSILK